MPTTNTNCVKPEILAHRKLILSRALVYIPKAYDYGKNEEEHILSINRWLQLQSSQYILVSENISLKNEQK